MLTNKNRAAAIPTTLTVNGQGVSITFNLTYFNRTQEEYAELLKSQIEKKTFGTNEAVAEQLQFMVKDWESDYPLSMDGFKQAESDFPGVLQAVIEGFQDARAMARVKNSKPQ